MFMRCIQSLETIIHTYTQMQRMRFSVPYIHTDGRNEV